MLAHCISSDLRKAWGSRFPIGLKPKWLSFLENVLPLLLLHKRCEHRNIWLQQINRLFFYLLVDQIQNTLYSWVWERSISFLHLSVSADKLIRFLCVCWQMMSRSYEENISAVNGIIIILLSVAKRSCWWHLMCSHSGFLKVHKTLTDLVLAASHRKMITYYRRQIFGSQKYGRVFRARWPKWMQRTQLLDCGPTVLRGHLNSLLSQEWAALNYCKQ